MNWIEKLFGKKEQLSSEIRFDELHGWLESRLEKISEELGSQAASVYSDIEDALENIRQGTSQLEEAKPEGRFHLKMVKIGTSNRDNMVKQVRMLIENIAVPKTTDIKTILFFHENAVQSLSVCLENMLKSHQYAKLVFLEESKQVITDVNELGRLLNKLIEPIDSRKNALEAFENAKNTIQIIKNSFSELEIEKKTIKEKEENIVLLKKEIEERQKALTLLKDGELWKQYQNYKNELVLLENKAKQAESEINALVLPLNKALTRLRQLSESGRYALKPEVREELYLCLSDPKSVKPEFFVEVKNIVEGDTLNLASGKKDKMLEQIRRVVSSFDSYKEQYQAVVLDIEKKKDEMSKMNINQEEKNHSDLIKTLQDKLAATEKELEISKKHIVSLEHSVELKKQELQQVISIIDSRMRVTF